MNQTPYTWQWKPLLTLNLAAVLLLASWLWAPTRHAWDVFDDRLFVLLNQPLAHEGWWAWVWGVGSLRPMDLAVGALMLVFLLRGNLVFSRRQVRDGVFAFVALLLLLLLMRAGFSHLLKLIDWQRPSPSLLVENAVRLSELFPDWERFELKDASSQSFPGDHASVLLLWALFLSPFARGWRLFAIWVIAGVCMLPRLVAGAHWGSDDFVGGLFLSLLAIAWGCYSPYCAWLGQQLGRLCEPLFGLLRRFPMLGRLALLQQERPSTAHGRPER